MQPSLPISASSSEFAFLKEVRELLLGDRPDFAAAWRLVETLDSSRASLRERAQRLIRVLEALRAAEQNGDRLLRSGRQPSLCPVALPLEGHHLEPKDQQSLLLTIHKENAVDLEHYLDSLSDASKRSRTVVIILVVACVLGVMGFLNSFRYSWIHQRIETLAKNEKYLAFKTGYIESMDEEIKEEDKEKVKEASKTFRDALIKSYVDNAFVIHVPFFGVTFDINDLSLIGGLGFIVVLTILRYSLRSEIICLSMGFRTAIAAGRLSEFYDLISTRQLFTLPKIQGGDKPILPNTLLRYLPRVVIYFPLLVYVAIVSNDMLTLNIGKLMGQGHTFALVSYSLLFLLLIFSLSIMCWLRWKALDDIWEKHWQKIHPETTSKEAPEKAS
jgi:hypothetical protein